MLTTSKMDTWQKAAHDGDTHLQSVQEDGLFREDIYIPYNGKKVRSETTTCFFRLHDLYQEILNYLVKQQTDTNPIHILIAGGSMGCEAYSAAILADNLFGPNHPFIFDTVDISEDMTEIARQGIYHKRMLEQVQRNFLSHFQDATQERFTEVKSDIKDKVNCLSAQKIESLEPRKQYTAVIAMHVLCHLYYHDNAQVTSNFMLSLTKLSHGIVCLNGPRSMKLPKSPHIKALEKEDFHTIAKRNWQQNAKAPEDSHANTTAQQNTIDANESILLSFSP